MTVRFFPAAGSVSHLLLTSGDGSKVRVTLASDDLKVLFNTASTLQGTGIDGKVIEEGKPGEAKAPPPPSELILQDGQLRLTVETLGANGRPEKVLFPRHPVFIRPDPATWANRRAGLYRPEERIAIEQKWAQAPSLSQTGVTLRLEHTGKRLRLWVDDRLVNTLPSTGEVNVSAPPMKEGGRLGLQQGPLPAEIGGAFAPVRLEGYVMEGADPKVKVELQAGSAKEVAKLFPAALEGRALDVGRSRWLQDNAFPLISRDNYAPVYFARSAFDRATWENLIFAIPNRDYRSVRLLCAPVPGRSPALSLRLTHFTEHSGDGGGVGNALADYTLALEKKDGRWPEGCREVGTVRLEDGTQAPLLMVEIPLTTGAIPDLVDAGPERGRRSTHHLDLELTKELQRVMPYNRAIHAMLPVGAPSGVQVLGITLEGAPRVRLLPRQVGSVYQPGEKTGWDLEITDVEGGFRGTLEWTHRTAEGPAAAPTSRPVAVAAGQESLRIPLDFKLDNGWHGFDFRLLDREGRLVWERSTSLAQLAADTRKAGKDSPYGTWWFRKIRNGTDDMAIVGPLLQRLGVRRVNPWRTPPTPDGKAMGAYGVSLSMLGTLKIKDSATLQKSIDSMTEQARLHPGIEWGMIFHENTIPKMKFEFPPEFIGREPIPLDEAQKADFQTKLTQARMIADFHRKLNPNVKLLSGNGSLSFAIALMRNGYPKDLVDLWGDETTGQSILPETPPSTTMNTLFWLREYSRKFGYDAPVTTGYEWTYRSTKPGDLSPLEQAQFYLRDILLAHAYSAPNINPGLIYDVGDAYYYSRWGGTGLMSRFPLLEPKPSYVAWAVLTRVLDQARYERNVPADSPTTNALEFRRGGEWLYALWLPRGEREVKLQFEPGAASIVQTDMMGRDANLPLVGNGAELKLSGSPVYLRSSKPLVGISSGETRLPEPEGRWAVVAPLGGPDQWKTGPKMDAAFENEQFDYPRIFAPFQLTSVPDPKKGAVSRLALEPNPKQPWPLIRYTTLQPASPIPLKGTPEAIGVWVRGNSSWGRIFFELEDATGRKLTSIGRPESGWSLNDWQGNHFVNFDGWNFIHATLPGWYGGSYPMPQNGNWRLEQEGPIVYPLKVTALIVEMREKVVRINEVVEVPDLSIDLSNLSILEKTKTQ